MRATSPTIEIKGRRVGTGCPTYIVAEMSANHGQDFEQALRILEAAREAGADAVKLQTYTSDTMTINCSNEHFQIKGTMWNGRNLYDLYAEASTPWEWQPRLKEAADRMGLDLFSTPFDETAVDFLEGMGVPAHKIASFEIVDIPLLRRIARTGKPLIVSTGMATRAEIKEAVDTIRAAGCTELALLKCTSAYPARPEEMNLRTIPEMAEEFRVPVGLSDHTMGWAAASAAVALGACIIEKHFTLSRAQRGPDSQFSMEPHEFKAMVESVRTIEKALGEVRYGANHDESKSRVFRRSLFVVEDIKAGDVLTSANVRSIRPGFGMHPRHLEEVVGRAARRDIARGTPLSWELVGENSV
jgi:pseudaminic acid synthase